MTSAAGHLGDRLSAYVDRSLAPQLLHQLDRHVVTCQACRAASDAERRLLLSLRAAHTPVVPSSLTAALRELAFAGPAGCPPSSAAHGQSSPLRRRDAVPVAVSRPLPVVPRRAPALHRSPVRAAMLAGLAAGASAVAAWGIGATGAAASGAPAAPSPLPGGSQVSGVSRLGADPAAVSFALTPAALVVRPVQLTQPAPSRSGTAFGEGRRAPSGLRPGRQSAHD